MIDLRTIRYLRIGTPDLGEATNFATTILGLEPAGRERGMAYFRSDERDHTICYVEGDPAEHVTAFEVSENADLDAIAAELERAGHPVHRGTAAEREVRRVLDFISFADPTGNRHRDRVARAARHAALFSHARRRHHGLQPHRLAHDRRAAR